MPLNTQEIVSIVCTLADEENVRVTIKESLKGAIIAGLSAATGAIAFGPVGLAVGGTIGSCCAAYVSHGKFKPLAEVIREMREDERERLANAILRVVNDIEITDAVALTTLIAGDLSIRDKVLKELTTYFTNQMRLEFVD